ncbi:hypothetical protein [Paractinoplanes brasiliensis]|uniref:Uncharacterized protein n=1 Tax=Paractinoplanes brasiliensis TaxID=52695 RepID=A0A4R6J860_9ACTN|nr:hypothetical protein [Actinoplanes brasiliensis]TDO31071.1 hypothetical protein C8E87_6481 [Actinoplanes brasiliensis]GID33295.1 hypothetical protein Abr02nite_82780 [Actinoplanes brasiliensis]
MVKKWWLPAVFVIVLVGASVFFVAVGLGDADQYAGVGSFLLALTVAAVSVAVWFRGRSAEAGRDAESPTREDRSAEFPTSGGRDPERPAQEDRIAGAPAREVRDAEGVPGAQAGHTPADPDRVRGSRGAGPAAPGSRNAYDSDVVIQGDDSVNNFTIHYGRPGKKGKRSS